MVERGTLVTPEGAVRAHLRKTAIAAGLEHRKLRWIGRRGAPDEMLFWPDKATLVEPGTAPLQCLVEVKKMGVEVDWSSPQGREITRLREAGFWVVVIDSFAGADLLVQSLVSVALGADR